MALLVNNLFPGEITPNAVVGGCIEIFENVWPNHKETINLVEWILFLALSTFSVCLTI
jgi:hypothetical protein